MEFNQSKFERIEVKEEEQKKKQVDATLDRIQRQMMDLEVSFKTKTISSNEYKSAIEKKKKIEEKLIIMESKYIQNNRISTSKVDHVMEKIQANEGKKKSCKESILFLKKSISKCSVKYNPDCQICISQPLFKQKQKLENDLISSNEIFQKVAEKENNLKIEVKNLLCPPHNNIIPEEEIVTLLNHQNFCPVIQVFWNQIKKEKIEFETLRDEKITLGEKVKLYEKKREFLQLQEVKNTKEKEKHVIEESLSQGLFFLQYHSLFKFIDLQYKYQHTDQSIIDRIQKSTTWSLSERVELKTKLEMNLENAIRKRRDFEKESNQNLKAKSMIEKLEEKKRKKEKIKTWLVECKKKNVYQNNTICKNLIEDNERKLEDIQFHEKNKDIIQFICDIHNGIPYFPSMSLDEIFKSIEKNKEDIQVVELEIETWESQIKNLLSDKTILKKIIETKKKIQFQEISIQKFEEEMIEKKCKIEEILIKKSIWKEHIQSLYTIQSQLRREKITLSLFEKNGLPLHLLRNKVQIIETKLNDMVCSFIPSKKFIFQLDEKNLDFGYKEGSNTICGFLSGMESFILDIVMKILLANVSSFPQANLFFIDEKLSVLDKDRLHNIELIFNVLKQTNKNICLISHIDLLRDFVDHSLHVEKKDKTSRVYFQ